MLKSGSRRWLRAGYCCLRLLGLNSRKISLDIRRMDGLSGLAILLNLLKDSECAVVGTFGGGFVAAYEFEGVVTGGFLKGECEAAIFVHEFTIGRRLYSVPDPDDEMHERKVIDESRTKLCDVVPRVGTQFLYAYDFGDDWRHELLLEAVVMAEPGTQYPRCIAGARRTPPEDVGGTPGYENYLEALAEPEHEEHENLLNWRGEFNAEAFSLDEVNQRLRK